jgi:hypothetical protein
MKFLNGQLILDGSITGTTGLFTGDIIVNGLTTGKGPGSVSFNTVFGFNALSGNTSGNYNVAIGTESLFNNTTGRNNISIGVSTLYSNTTGRNNTAIGDNVLGNNTTGGFNTSVGYSSLSSNVNGFDNVAVGGASLYGNTSGELNVGLGVNTLYFNQTGSNNIAIGYYALKLTNASNNIAIGYEAGDSNTTGTNNIFIGYQTNGVDATQSGRTWIGNSATTSTWLGGNVLIGTTTDSGYKLNVNGNTAVRGSLLVTDTVGTLRTAISGYDSNEIAFRGSRWSSSNGGLATLDGNNLNLESQPGGGVLSGNQAITIQNINGNVPTTYINLKGVGPVVVDTNRTRNIVNIGMSLTVPSGSTNINFNSLNISPSINYGGVSGNSTVIGILYSPTITSLVGNHIAIQTTVGNLLFGTLSGNTIIGTTNDFGQRLQVSGTSFFNGVIPFSANNQTLAMVDIQPNFNRASYTGTTALALRVSGGTQIIGSGSTGTTLSVFSVDGASGRLFDVSDDLSSTLFSVNTIAGLPVIEAYATSAVVMGKYGQNALVVSGTSVGVGTSSPQAKLHVNGTMLLGNLSGDPAGSNGMLYYNTTTNKFRGYENGAWADLI